MKLIKRRQQVKLSIDQGHQLLIKATARNEITTILNNKLQAIQATPDATDEEKQAAETEANTENAKDKSSHHSSYNKCRSR